MSEHYRTLIADMIFAGDPKTDIKKLPVQGEHLKEFEHLLNKYGVSYSIIEDPVGGEGGKPRYLCFFKAKDEDALAYVYEEAMARQLGMDGREKKPSVIKIIGENPQACLWDEALS